MRERRPLYKAYRQIDFLIPLVWQCTEAEPARGVFALIDEIERGGRRRSGGSHNQGIVAITHTPGFPPADIADCGPALVVYGHDRETAEAAADRLAAAIQAREADFAGKLYDPDEAVAEALRLARRRDKAGHPRRHPGQSRRRRHLRHGRAVARADRAAGRGRGDRHDRRSGGGEAAHGPARGRWLDCGIGAKVGFAGETPVEAEWRVVRLGSGDFIGSGPMYGGAHFDIGPMALVTDEASGVSAVLAAKRIQAADQEMFRHVGVEPARCRSSALKSTVHFRADFQPIAETILCVRAPGRRISPTRRNCPTGHLRRGIRLHPLGPTRT